MHTNSSHPIPNTQTTLDQLQAWLRSELAAEETYQSALGSVTHTAVYHALHEILASHARRSMQIRQRIIELGGKPETSSGVWGAFTKAIQAGADLLGDRAAITALEEGEDHSLRLYWDGLSQCDAGTRRLAENILLPEEQRTHELCQTLKKYLRHPS